MFESAIAVTRQVHTANSENHWVAGASHEAPPGLQRGTIRTSNKTNTLLHSPGDIRGGGGAGSMKEGEHLACPSLFLQD